MKEFVEADHLDPAQGPSPKERSLFLQDITAAAKSRKQVLGLPASGERKDEPEQSLQKSLIGLGEETAEFSPVLDVFPLDASHFTRRHIEMPVKMADLIEHFNYYLVNIPITLVPRSGWGFTQLECSIAFNSSQPPEQRPTAYQIFPKEEWKQLIGASQSLSVGLDENLEFKLDTQELAKDLPGMDAKATANAGLKTHAGFVLGPFEYSVWRSDIIARGQGNVKAYWKLNGQASLERQEPRLGVVLKAPKTVSRIDITGALTASRSFHTFTADLRDLLTYVREKTRRFFEQGAPLHNTMQWSDITSQVRGN